MTEADRARSLNLLLDVVRAASTHHARARMLDALLRPLRSVIPSDFVMIGVLDNHGMFDILTTDPPMPLPSLRVSDYAIQHVLGSGRPQRLQADTAARFAASSQLRAQSGALDSLAIPMIVAGAPIGWLALGSLTEDAYAAIDLDLAAELGAAVAVVVDSCLARERLAILRDQEEAENDELSGELRVRQSADGLIGDCPAFRSVKQLVDLVGPTRATVLLAGETGSGKEVVARAIHEASPRRGRPLVTVNCAALPSNLAESELFGHEQGAFTGASRRREGCFERAAGGTLFLDEVGELALDVQAKLLRALQERQIERVGGSEPISLDVRIVAATNRDLTEMVAARRFREDLYYRLAVFPIEIPPLRARHEDIPSLVEFFVARAATRLRAPARTVDDATMARLTSYEWPGNLRELQNAIERAMIVSTGTHLELDALLPAPVVTRPRLPAVRAILPAGTTADEHALRDEYARALDEAAWVIEGPTGAAARLGVHPNTLRYRLKRLGLTRPG